MKNQHNAQKRYLKSNRLTIGVLLFLSCFTSCKKELTVDPPTNTLATGSVFKNDGSVIAAQLAVYSLINANQGTLELYSGLSSDELTNYSNTQLKVDLYHNNLAQQNDGGLGSIWNIIYGAIYGENAILQNLPSSNGISPRIKQLTTGEALFGRAYLYFQLVNMFGDVPLVLTTDYTKNSALPRTPKDQVYGQIVTDLKAAQGLLSQNYLDPSDNVTTDKVRPTTWAADALLARVYLYMGKYDLAEQQASLVIASSNFSLSPISGANSVFTINSSEAIWQLTPSTSTKFTNEGLNFVIVKNPTSSIGGVSLSPQMLNAFEANDARQVNWIGSFSQGSNTWYFPYKYKATSTATILTEYSMVLRLGEQYLIRAEARAQQGKLIGPASASEDLNIIRMRAGLPNYAGMTDQTSLLTAIMHERQVELFTEGHRWYDLKRTKTVDAVMSVVTPTKNGTWQSYQQLYPLPVADLTYDPNLVQNTGY
ncbi:MAG TPA: RagB/SusD family nutrient uptake outer membrane protein [Mucilaginibacter sp.]